MIYEGTIRYEVTTNKCNVRTVRESYLIENVDTFSQAEIALTTYALASSINDVDVVSLKRSKIKEIANKNRDTEPMFIATLADVFTDENGIEKELTYDIAFFSLNIEEAHNFIRLYAQQGYCMEMKALKQAKFIDVIDGLANE